MPQSQTAADLIAAGKLYYGDPCYDSTFGSTKAKCEEQTHASNLAYAVLQHYNIEVADEYGWILGTNASKNACCCPLDILNQDPLACIKMALSASLLDSEYWEVYADEWGKANFVKVLPEDEARVAKLPRVQYCTPSMQPADIANLVIVRSADPPPFRKCGKIKGQDWYDILDGASVAGIDSICNTGHLFPGKGAGDDARGIMFSWGEVTGFSSQGTDPTCEVGRFDQFGTIIYPDYERKQIYNDGITDFYEIEGFEQILFWMVDVDYNVSDDELAHYSIQFVKSSDVPVKLGNISVGDTFNKHLEDFGPICDIGDTGTGSTPNISVYQDFDEKQSQEKSCASVQASIHAANERKKWFMSWDEYSTPSFYGYGYAKTLVSFNDYSKWNIVGADTCLDEPIDNMYESTSSIWFNGCPLEHWYWSSFLGTNWAVFGIQKGKKTMDLPQGTVWVDSGDDGQGHLVYSFRAEAPSKASAKYGDQPWFNPFYNHMLNFVYNPTGGNSAGLFLVDYKYPGYLFGWDDSLYTISNLWAKIKIARPGISIQGFGRGVKSFMPGISLRIKPVYQVDFPAAVAARGEAFNGCVDVYKDLANANQAYCEPIPVGPSEAEKLQEAMTGNTIDLTIPFLFPDFAGAGQSNPSQVKDKRAFDALCKLCLDTAGFLWDYVKKYKDEPNKGYTYICGPPKAQDEVPKLGDVVDTEHGKRTINSIAYNYSDGSSFTVNVEVGPVQVSTAHAGSLTSKRKKNEEVRGKIVDQGMGALYKVDVGGIGIIQAWNIDKHPWDIGDKVTVTLYNHPAEL
jgi:hypothetical protein